MVLSQIELGNLSHQPTVGNHHQPPPFLSSQSSDTSSHSPPLVCSSQRLTFCQHQSTKFGLLHLPVTNNFNLVRSNEVVVTCCTSHILACLLESFWIWMKSLRFPHVHNVTSPTTFSSLFSAHGGHPKKSANAPLDASSKIK